MSELLKNILNKIYLSILEKLIFKSEFSFSFIRKFCVKRGCKGMAFDALALKINIKKELLIYKSKIKIQKILFFAIFMNNSGFSIYFIFFEKTISPVFFSICIFLLFLFSKTVIFPISFQK